MVRMYGTVEEGSRPLPTGSQRRKLVVVAGALCLAAAAVALVSYSAAGRTSLESSGHAEIRALRALQESDSLLREADAARVRRAKRAVAAVQPAQPVQRRLTGAAKIKFEAKQLEQSALRGRKAHAAQLRTRRFSRLDGEDGEDAPVLGPAAVSKWVPEDHPEGHKECPLEDEDCDELWPWGKVHVKETGPPKRNSILGDNMVGLGSEDDVVVNTEDSGLISKAQPYEDHFDHWPENSKKNKDLLYGSARGIISHKYLGIGDQYVPIEKLEDAYTSKAYHRQPIADLAFGSWEMGFNKPKSTAIKEDKNMFDQPYRQHMAAAHGDGHQVFSVPSEVTDPLGPTVGDDEEE